MLSFGFVCLFLFGAALGEEEAMSALNLGESNFKDEVGSGPHLIMFFAPWCGHCKRLAPTWEELATKYNKAEEKEVTIAKVDCTQETALCSAQDVTGYPTLKFFKSGFEKEDGVKYRGNRDMKALEKYIQEQLGNEVAEEPEKAAATAEATLKDGLHVLTAASFAKTIAEGDTLVKFYAPWCGHCIKLAPTWDELAKAYESEADVKIAKIDCTEHQSVCQENDVRGYPTLALFKAGRKHEVYKGARALGDLKDFIEENKGAAGVDKEDGKVPDAKPTPVLKMDKDNFDQEIKEGTVFVKFFAPWCGHCKRMAPTWEQLAASYEDNAAVKIGHVDCTADDNQNRAICDSQGVNGFPTLIVYKDGKKIEEYSGKRDLSALQDFVDKHAKAEAAAEEPEAAAEEPEEKPKDEL